MRWKAKTRHMDKNLLVKHEEQINPQNLGQRIRCLMKRLLHVNKDIIKIGEIQT
jgi:hypothetical protein